MSQDEISQILLGARKGAQLMISYDSPRGERRFAIPIVSVKFGEHGDVQRVRLERGTSAWMFVQRAKQEDGELRWCFYQPNPYPIYEVEIVTS